MTCNSSILLWIKYKVASTSKCKFSDFSLLAIKSTKFIMSFLEPRISFFQTLDNSSVSLDITLLYLPIYKFVCSGQKEDMGMQIFRLSTYCQNISQILYVTLQATSHLFLILYHLSFSCHIIPLKCSSWKIMHFGQKQPMKVQFFTLWSALMKVHSIPHAISETTRPGFIQHLRHQPVSCKTTTLQFFYFKSYII